MDAFTSHIKQLFFLFQNHIPALLVILVWDIHNFLIFLLDVKGKWYYTGYQKKIYRYFPILQSVECHSKGQWKQCKHWEKHKDYHQLPPNVADVFSKYIQMKIPLDSLAMHELE